MDRHTDAQMAIEARDYQLLDEIIGSIGTNAVDEGDYTLLMSAILTLESEPDVTTVRYLIGKGVDVNARCHGQWTALHFAARDQREEIVTALIEAGANVDPLQEHGNTPLWHCVMHNSPNLNIVNALVSAGADPRKKNKFGNSPIDVAEGNDEVIEILRARGS